MNEKLRSVQPARSMGRRSFLQAGVLAVAYLVCPGLGCRRISDHGDHRTWDALAPCEPGVPRSWPDAHDVKSYGAKGDGRTDDATAIARAVEAAAAQHGTVYLPAGTYRYSEIPIRISEVITVQGAGKRQTFLKPLPNYHGYAVRIEDCWRGRGERPAGATLEALPRRAGVVLRDFSIVGDRESVAYGIQTYERTDFLNIENVDLIYLRGTALELGVSGATKNRSIVRESHFRNVFVRLSGDIDVPPLHISTGPEAGDGTNQLEFFGCGLVENYSSSVIDNANLHGLDTRRIQFYGLMLHGRGAQRVAPADDLLRIAGRVNDVAFFGMRANGSHAVGEVLYATVRIVADSSGTRILEDGQARPNFPSGIQFIGADTRNCAGHGFLIDRVGTLLITGIANNNTIAGNEIRFAPDSVAVHATYAVEATGRRSIAIGAGVAARVSIQVPAAFDEAG